MELNIKFDEKMLVAVANRVLDEYEYNGKTIREWADIISNPRTNADRIRVKSDEELAEFMCRNVSNGTVNCAFCSAEEFCHMGHNGWIDWLKQEVVDDKYKDG